MSDINLTYIIIGFILGIWLLFKIGANNDWDDSEYDERFIDRPDHYRKKN